MTHPLRYCFAVCVIALLLLISGVEPNPGPVKNEDIARRMDDLTTKYEDIVRHMDVLMQELVVSRTALEKKIDSVFNDVITRVHMCEQQMATFETRFTTIEATLVTTSTDVNVLKSDALSWPTLHSSTSEPVPSTAAMTSNINNLIQEVNLRNDKKRTVVIQGLPQTGLPDVDVVRSISTILLMSLTNYS